MTKENNNNGGGECDNNKKKRRNKDKEMLDDIQKSIDQLMALKLQLLKSFESFSPPSKQRESIIEGELDFEDSHLLMDDSEGDDDTKACFPCPFCYVDIEIHMVCSHLQEEHCFDLKNAVCPMCAANLGKDVIGHFIVQHASSLKRRRKSQKSGLWNGGSATLGKELSSFLGSSTIGRGNAHESVPDSLLSPFLGSEPLADNKDIQQEDCSNKISVASDSKSSSVEDVEERRQRATFVQQMIMSTVFEVS